jgi:DNA topoisomerase-2
VEVLEEYFPLRMTFYERRRAHQLAVLTVRHTNVSQRVRFIDLVGQGQITLGKQSRDAIEVQLRAHSLPAFPTPEASALTASGGTAASTLEQDDADDEDREGQSDELKDVVTSATVSTKRASRPFDHLLNMPLSSLTQERGDALRGDLSQLTSQLAALRATTPQAMWLADLAALEHRLIQQIAAIDADTVRFLKSSSAHFAGASNSPAAPATSTRKSTDRRTKTNKSKKTSTTL